MFAKRAIEARYVVDLASMTANELLVSSPQDWADQIYAYGFNIPAITGQQVVESGVTLMNNASVAGTQQF